MAAKLAAFINVTLFMAANGFAFVAIQPAFDGEPISAGRAFMLLASSLFIGGCLERMLVEKERSQPACLNESESAR